VSKGTREIGKTEPVKVSRSAARRFLVRRSGLASAAGEPVRWSTSEFTLDAVRSLEYVQVDPMYVLERNHDLVLAARVNGYRPEVLDRLLYHDRKLVEVVARNRYIIPVEDYSLFRERFAEIERENRPRLAELEPVMAMVLSLIEAQGPMSSLDFDDDARLSGWWDADGHEGTRAVRQALEWLWHFGRLAVSHREGSRRYFDLPERLFGAESTPGPYLPEREGAAGRRAGQAGGTPGWRDALARKYFRAMGLADPRDWAFGWARYGAAEKKALVERFVGAGEIVPVEVEGVRTRYYAPAPDVPDLIACEDLEVSPEIRFLPPLDNLIWLRPRLSDLFSFEYTWEAYVPAAKRKYGPYTCPILYGEWLAGRIDARVDRKNGGGEGKGAALIVNGLWWEDDRDSADGGSTGLRRRPSEREFRDALERWAEVNGAAAIQGLST